MMTVNEVRPAGQSAPSEGGGGGGSSIGSMRSSSGSRSTSSSLGAPCPVLGSPGWRSGGPGGSSSSGPERDRLRWRDRFGCLGGWGRRRCGDRRGRGRLHSDHLSARGAGAVPTCREHRNDDPGDDRDSRQDDDRRPGPQRSVLGRSRGVEEARPAFQAILLVDLVLLAAARAGWARILPSPVRHQPAFGVVSTSSLVPQSGHPSASAGSIALQSGQRLVVASLVRLRPQPGQKPAPGGISAPQLQAR